MKKMVHTLTVDLPDDFMDAAEVAAKIKPHLAALTTALTEAKIDHKAEIKHMTVKASPATPRTKRGAATPPAAAAA